MKTIRKLRMLLTLALLCWASMAWAVDVTGNVDGQNITTNTTWNVTGTVNLRGQIVVKSGATLTIQPKSGSTANRVIRRRYNASGNAWSGYMFYVEDGASLVVKSCTTNGTIYKMYFDGGATFPGNDARQTVTSHYGEGGIIHADGNLTMTNAVIRYCYYPGGQGGGILCYNDGTTARTCNLTNVIIVSCYAQNGGAVYFRAHDYHNATFKNVEIYRCATIDGDFGGTIRQNGGGQTTLTLDGCNIHDNYTNKCGGATTWNPSGRADNKLIIKGNTKLHHNVADQYGGAIIGEARIDLQSVEIYNNTAARGGGIYLKSYSGNALEYDGNGFNLTIRDGVSIHDNTATQWGGGIGMLINRSDDIGYNANNQAISPLYKVSIEGGTIYHNTAPQGAGVAILDNAPKKHYGQNAPVYHVWSGEFRRQVSITGGSIYNNICTATANNAQGGGIYILKYKDNAIDDGSAGYTYTQAGGAGTMTVNATGGLIYNNTSLNDNKNGVGGGLYINNSIPEAPYNSVCTMTVGGNVEIYDNKSYSHGAGVYIANGNVTVNGGTVGKSGHPNISYNGNGAGFYVANGNVTINSGNVDYNQAKNGPNASGSLVGGYGGAFYLSGGIATINGGSVSSNSADKNGGGFYVNVANTSSVTTIKGGANVGYNTAVNGGGAFINQGQLTIQDAATSINHNTASAKGGGIYMAAGTVSVANAQILNNTATSDGGGLFAGGGNVTVTGAAHINGNQARDGGGGYVNNGTLTLTGSGNGIQVNNNNATYTSTSYGNGGGFFVGGGNVSISGVCQVDGNTATDDGGGFYTTGGTVTISGANAVISNNSASYWGGGIRAGGNVTLTGGQIYKNHANARGGGVYVHGGTFTMSNGTIGGTTTNGNYTTNVGSNGGGVYMNAGTATLTGGTISGNYTNNGYGGGIYMYGGRCDLSNGATIGGASASYANSSKYGGGIYSAGGTITVKGGKIQRNTASTAGGGIYTNGADGIVNMEKQTSKAEALSYIEYNTAQEGGGIYANRGVVNFSDGFIQYNYASEAGGGIYVNDNGDDDYGTLNLTGSANLRRNHVPEGHNGGGVYLKGKVVVGEQTANLGVIKAQENYAGDEYIYEWNDTGSPTDSIDQVTANNRNNIYLPNPGDTLVLTNHRDVITVIENGISLDSRVGFSVPHNYVPVIYCAPSATSQAYLDIFTTGPGNVQQQYMLFDDTRHYVSVHYSDRPAIFDPDHVYLYGFWANVVTGHSNLECDITAADFEAQGDTIEISNACELAFFISWVNGLNGLERHPGANAIVTADIDMSKYGWVPIGDLTGGYSGTFDGNGHTITGISSLVYREYVDYGFFGRLNGGTVKNLFVKDAVYALVDMPNLVVGGLVGYINTASTVANCEASSKITASNTGTVMGGLIGRMNAGTVHSTIGISDMKGYLMGGLVGELLGGSLYNSFSNCKYTKADPGHQKYMGGLVAVNRGTVENCYSRRRGSVPKGNFGILVGDNTNGLMTCCYAPAGETNYKVIGNSLMGHGNYGDTYLPYLYGHRDTQISLANNQNNYVPSFDGLDKQMLLALNSWVDANSTSSVTYTKWGRPWHENDNVKPLNDDFPILRMPMCEAVGAKKDDPYLYYNPVDSLLVRYTAADEAIWLYNNPADVVRGDNSASAAKLYIAEDVALINLNELKAYVGITLDNSAGGNGAGPTYGEVLGINGDGTDWHLFSTSLSNAPTGINYSDGRPYEFSYGHPTGMPYYLFYEKGDARNGYFPSHRFNKSYPSSDLTIEEGNYYQEWDFYCYSEPCYHWINFKRNSASHRRYDTEQHEPIAYDNEPTLGVGKGYFFATREETFLQCQGNLNTDEVIIGLTYTPNVPRHGYNLIGNPYQAYLDFNAFAEANQGDVDGIWDAFETPSYTILDEDCGGYVTFAYDESNNPDAAGRFIHPHQGFFVRTLSGYSNAYFEPEMRNASDTVTSVFRNDNHIDYPLVNLFVSEANGVRDMVTVELGRPEQGGAALLAGLRAGNGKIWCHYNDKDYTVAYTEPGITEAAIRFETFEDTEYTMRWNTYNGDFSYLHLIDNLTGADVDCLSESEYRFSASTSDYKSRFRLVFGYTGIEEDIEAEANTNFAFMMGDELVVTGEGMLQVFDVNGRMLVNQELHGVQTMVSLPNVANGVYVLRLTEGSQSRVQKMVISK